MHARFCVWYFTPPRYFCIYSRIFHLGPETFRAHFGWHNSLYIFKTKAYRGTKLCSYFNFCSQHMKRSALQNKRVRALRIAFWACKVFGIFEKRALDLHVTDTSNRRREILSEKLMKAMPIAFIPFYCFYVAIRVHSSIFHQLLVYGLT